MDAKKASGDLGEPRASEWSSIPAEQLELSAVPIGGQPSNYIRTTWADRPYGLVHDLKAQAAHDGEKLYLRLEWISPTRQALASGNGSAPHPIEGPDAFPDAMAAMFPANGKARLESMGSTKAPVAMWHWSADATDKAEELTSTGIGSVRPADESDGLSVKVAEDGASWQVVIARPLKGKAAPNFTPGGKTQVAFAVWAGVNQERAGIKSASSSWVELTLEK